MKERTLTARIGIATLGILLFAASGVLAWVILNDYQLRDTVPWGVTMAGKDLSRLTVAQVRSAVDEAVSAPMLTPISVTNGAKSWTFDPKGIVTIGTDKMTAEAYSTRRAAAFLARVDSDLIRRTTLPIDVKPAYSVDTSAVESWVKERASEVNSRPVDASRTIEGYKFKITPSAKGARLNVTTSTNFIANALNANAALSSPQRTVALAVEPITPRVLESSFKGAIIVSLDDTRIYLYDGAKLVKSYLCAPGRPAWPTPTGNFKIISKQKNAPWYNPHSSWSASMPEVIPGGPSNPMGDTKIGIDYPGVFMHSVPPSEFSSIGTHASHGCMRMLPSSVHDLYKRVTIGMPVFIRH